MQSMQLKAYNFSSLKGEVVLSEKHYFVRVKLKKKKVKKGVAIWRTVRDDKKPNICQNKKH